MHPGGLAAYDVAHDDTLAWQRCEQAPDPVRDDGVTDYFATSFPELLLFAREPRDT